MFQKKAKHRIDNEIKKMNVTVTAQENLMKDGSTLVTKTDLQGRITYANQNFAEISKIPEEELLGKPHSIIRHPDMPRSAFSDMWETLKSGRPWRGMVKNRASDGNFYWVDANAAPRVENGSTVGYISVRRKPSREAVAKAETLYRDIREGRKIFPWSDKPAMSLRAKGYLITATAGIFFLLVTAADYLFHDYYIGPVIAVAGATGFTFSLNRLIFSLIEGIDRAASIGNQIAQGNLTASIEHNRNDELGSLYKAMLNLLVNNAGIIAQLQENGIRLKNSAKFMNEASENLSAGAEETSAQSVNIAAGATQMNQNLQTLASSVEEMSISIGEVAKKAADSAKIVMEANAEAEATRRVVTELGENAREIGTLVENISSIAGQTNLLALNASIEAAGAGEMGRGFGVVAAEVKQLALQATQMAGSAKETINRISASVHSSVESVSKITGTFSQVKEIATHIASAVEEQSITAREIAANVAESSKAAGEVTRNINEISKVSQDSAESAAEISRMSVNLSKVAEELSSIAALFRV